MGKRKEIYLENKSKKTGEACTCPVCGSAFTKKQWSQAFCCGHCKDAYWNAKKDRHRGGITGDARGYHKIYNMEHPERLERVGIYKENGEFGYLDGDGDFVSFREEYECWAMCENPIEGR